MRYLAVIPARGGSKGVPGKNIRPLAGKPLIAWTIEQCLSCDLISKTVVSTDDELIADVARQYGAEVPFIRPKDLANDETPTEPVLRHAIEWFQFRDQYFDAVILMQPTSPLRYSKTIVAAIKKFESNYFNSLVGVCENHHFFWRNVLNPEALYDYRHRPRRQDIDDEKRWYRETGSIYITNTKAFLNHGNRLCEPIAIHVMHENEGFEIDSMTDFNVLEMLMVKSFGL
jgi:CMP-N,N'-diacetyllegionaminic acid synthase